MLFVCIHNAGQSQMAAGYLRHLAGDRIEVRSAGTEPKAALNPLSVESLEEVGASTAGEFPKPVDPGLLARMDAVITLGAEAKLQEVPGPTYETWLTDEPSERGIDGIERMRLVRDDIAERVRQLVARLS